VQETEVPEYSWKMKRGAGRGDARVKVEK